LSERISHGFNTLSLADPQDTVITTLSEDGTNPKEHFYKTEKEFKEKNKRAQD